jgi:hypothetical protein
MKKPFLFLCFLALGLSTAEAQSPFKQTADSLWFMDKLPYPVVSMEFNFAFNSDMFQLNGIKQDSSKAKETEKLPQSLDSLQNYFRKNPSSGEAAYQIFLRFQAKGDADVGESYLKRAIELKASKGIQGENLDELRNAIGLLVNYYGRESYPNVLELVQAYTNKYPKEIQAWNLQAIYQMNSLDTLGADSSILRSLALDELNAETYVVAMQLEINKNIFKLEQLNKRDSLAIKNGTAPLLTDFKRFEALAKKHPKSELPRLAMNTLELIETYSMMLLTVSDSIEGKTPLTFKLDKNRKKQLERLNKYYVKLEKNKKIKERYLVHKSLMLLQILQNNMAKADEYYALVCKDSMAQRDASVHKLSGVGHFMRRDYGAFGQRLDRTLKQSFSLSNALLYSRILFMNGQLDSCNNYLGELLNRYTDPKIVMGLVCIAFKTGKLQEGFQYLQAIINLPEEHPFRNEDFYFFLALGLYLDNKPEQAKSLLENVAKKGREYDIHAKRFLDYFFKS